MYLTKLSKKYHLLSREQQLQQIREITFEDSEGESSSSVQEVWRRPQRLPPVAAAANGPSSASSSSASSNSVHRPGSAPFHNAHRPSTETVVIPSSTSSESSRSGQDNGDNNERSVILNAMGANRNIDFSLQPSTCRRTSCAAWKRLESTHIDHIEEAGRQNISLWTDDLSTIHEVDPSASFVTARTHFTQATSAGSRDSNTRPSGALNRAQPRVLADSSSSANDELETSVPTLRRQQQAADFRQSTNKRRSVLGRNEVILLTSDSDSSDDDGDDDKENDEFVDNRPQSLSDFMSESRIASVEQWIVSSPFRSKSQIKPRPLEEVPSPRPLHQSTTASSGSNRRLDSSEATSKRVSSKVSICYRVAELNLHTLHSLQTFSPSREPESTTEMV